MTIEELQAEVLKLKEELSTSTGTHETLTKESQADKIRIQELQEHNQKLFLKITTKEEKKKDAQDNEVLSCEDFAKTLKL